MKFIEQACFFHKAHQSLLELRIITENVSSTLGAILNSEITNKTHKNAENVALTRPPEGHLFKDKT